MPRCYVTSLIYMPKYHNLKIKVDPCRDLSPKLLILEKINLFYNCAPHWIPTEIKQFTLTPYNSHFRKIQKRKYNESFFSICRTEKLHSLNKTFSNLGVLYITLSRYSVCTDISWWKDKLQLLSSSFLQWYINIFFSFEFKPLFVIFQHNRILTNIIIMFVFLGRQWKMPNTF